MNPLVYLYYPLVVLSIYAFAFVYNRKTKKWLWSEYFLIASAPFFGTLVIAYFEGYRVLLYYFICGILGSVGELGLGLISRHILGKSLWIYTKYPLAGGLTSLLNFPFWAGGGILFFFLAKILT